MDAGRERVRRGFGDARINGHVIRGHGEDGVFSNCFNYCGFGNFYAQVGELRVSNVTRYK